MTIADFACQALICKLIKERFPDDPIVAEEDSNEIRKPHHAAILEHVTHYVGLFIPDSRPADVCSWIDFGRHTVSERFWALDPIDGTKGFLRGDQYAIALALIEGGVVKSGVLACPNLHADPERPQETTGCLFAAVRGKGAFQAGLDGRKRQKLSVSKTEDPSEITFTESVEPDHADHLYHERLARKLKISKPSLRLDSQAKYGVVARGEASLYLRVPSSSELEYREKIWDHAAGAIIAEEAGGRVTDVCGAPLDFSSGIRLERNSGVVVTNGRLHEVILDALRSAEEAEPKSALTCNEAFGSSDTPQR